MSKTDSSDEKKRMCKIEIKLISSPHRVTVAIHMFIIFVIVLSQFYVAQIKLNKRDNIKFGGWGVKKLIALTWNTELIHRPLRLAESHQLQLPCSHFSCLITC